MNITSPHNILEIKQSPVHGRGVFAKSLIKKEQEIDCDVITVPGNNIEHKDYYYPWEGSKVKSMCIGFGFFLNHSTKPNMIIHKVDRIKLVKTFKALCDIEEGSEIFINYGQKFNT